ncbi:hypothetical protein [Tumebacillus permanentifrigoris]|uniref:Lipoprotein n=1 Tax=Tumebacillus permanentifrigoris TaxID=378543 RepID=A0A316D7K4_9BACL|nr:hypothetical protein [Tumebacillus permanentifrigoris]PWK10255.1 hypothetical protein C7459_11276 [Tumebacillus permanentifrigoris]
MKKFTKLALAAMLVMTAVVGVGCSKTDDTKTNTATETKKEDPEKINRAVFAAALIADEKMTSQFSKAVKGIDDAGKDTAYTAPSKKQEESLTFLDPYWGKDAATKEYTAALGDATLLAKVNKEAEALVNKNNAAAKDESKKTKFTPLTAVADPAKLGKNNIAGAKAQYADVKVESKDSKYTVTYKGLTYTLEKSGNTYKVVSKEGTLTK